MNIKKIKKNIYEIKTHCKNHGFKYAFSFFVSCFNKKVKYKTRLKGIKTIEEEFQSVFDEFEERSTNKQDNEEFNKVFFVYWSQGVNKLNSLTKRCIQQLQKYFPDYKICLIDDYNYSDYVDIDEHIIDLYKKKKITVQTFSDIMRFNLLRTYGGVWVDSTLLFFNRFPLDELVKKNGFLSLNHISEEKNNIWGKVYPVCFTTFFMGTTKHNPIMKACIKLYSEYYKKYDFAIDYFMTDYFLIICAKRKLNNDQLNNIAFWEGSPFYLIKNYKNDRIEIDKIKQIPQKLDWRSYSEDQYAHIFDKIL